MTITMSLHLEMNFYLHGKSGKIDWSMHMQWLHRFFLSNLRSELIAWNDLALTMATSGRWLVRWYYGCTILYVPTKKWWTKVLMKLLIYFGKNISLTELALTVIDQVILKMMVPSPVELTFGTRCTLYLSLRCLVLLHVKQHQSVLG